MRTTLCITLVKTLNHQTITADVLASRASMIGSIFADVTQITAAALTNCSLVLINTIHNNSEICATEILPPLYYEPYQMLFSSAKVCLRNSLQTSLMQ